MKFGSYSFIVALNNILGIIDPELKKFRLRTAFVSLELGKLLSFEKVNLDELVLKSLSLEKFTEERECFCFKNLQEEIVYAAAVTVEPLKNRRVCIFSRDLVEKQVKENYLKRAHNENIYPALLSLFDKEYFWFSLQGDFLERDILPLSQEHEKLVNVRGIELEQVQALITRVISAKDRYTSEHSIEVGSIAKAIGKYLGFGGEHLEMLEIAGLLHDLGKLAVPLKILNKPGKLTAKEFELIKMHPFYTYKTLSQVQGMEKIACWAGYHHERLDGNGYPFHLTSKELELESRIIQVADVLAALLEDRPYRRALTPHEIFQILRGEVEKGKLDSQVVEVGLKVVFQPAFQVR